MVLPTRVKTALLWVSFPSLAALIERAPLRLHGPLVAAIRAVVLIAFWNGAFSYLADWVSYWSYTGDISGFVASVLTGLFFLLALAAAFFWTAFVEQLYKRLSAALARSAPEVQVSHERWLEALGRLAERSRPLGSGLTRSCAGFYEACRRASDAVLDRAPGAGRTLSERTRGLVSQMKTSPKK